MRLPRLITLKLVLVGVTPMALFCGYFLIYEPLKYSYLTRVLADAGSSEDERRALRLAKDWGEIWEVHVMDSRGNRQWSTYRELLAGRHGQSVEIEIEWLASTIGGEPYRAKRRLLELTNIAVLAEH